MAQVRCPTCFNRTLQVEAKLLAEVRFDQGGDHDVLSTDGDIEFGDDSNVVCATNHGGCGHSGTLKEFSQ